MALAFTGTRVHGGRMLCLTYGRGGFLLRALAHERQRPCIFTQHPTLQHRWGTYLGIGDNTMMKSLGNTKAKRKIVRDTKYIPRDACVTWHMRHPWCAPWGMSRTSPWRTFLNMVQPIIFYLPWYDMVTRGNFG